MILAGTALATLAASLGVDSSRGGGKKSASAVKPHAFDDEKVEVSVTFHSEHAPWSNDLGVWSAEDRHDAGGRHRHAIEAILAFHFRRTRELTVTSGGDNKGRVHLWIRHHAGGPPGCYVTVSVSQLHQSVAHYEDELGVSLRSSDHPNQHPTRAVQNRIVRSGIGPFIHLANMAGVGVDRPFETARTKAKRLPDPTETTPAQFVQIVLNRVMEALDEHRQLYAENDEVIRNTILEMTTP